MRSPLLTYAECLSASDGAVRPNRRPGDESRGDGPNGAGSERGGNPSAERNGPGDNHNEPGAVNRRGNTEYEERLYTLGSNLSN